jgi:hypothetical protein
MKLGINPAGLRDTRCYEYALRFMFGGLITVAAGLIAEKFGPAIGGLFLAFPAILPASATLIESHERRKKERAGLHGDRRGRNAAGVDAAGAALGSIGLVAFAIVCWRLLPNHDAAIALGAATLAWFAVAITAWRIREQIK